MVVYYYVYVRKPQVLVLEFDNSVLIPVFILSKGSQIGTTRDEIGCKYMFVDGFMFTPISHVNLKMLFEPKFHLHNSILISVPIWHFPEIRYLNQYVILHMHTNNNGKLYLDLHFHSNLEEIQTDSRWHRLHLQYMISMI